MAKARLVQKSDGIGNQLQQMLERGSKLQSYLETTVFDQYKNAQAARWQSVGSSEGAQWPDYHDPGYEERKIKLIQSITPKKNKKISKDSSKLIRNNMTDTGLAAQGKKMMILTGRLADAALGKSPALLKIVTPSGIKLFIDDSVLPYAKFAASIRPMMVFSDATTQEMIDGAVAYMMNGDA